MARIVMKFGGSSVADIDRIKKSAQHVKREFNNGNEVVVVLSAMFGETNRLAALAMEASPLHDAREYDVVVATGEQVTIGLMAIVLQSMGISARSWLGWQTPIITSGEHSVAQITKIKSRRLINRIQDGQVAVIAGFQGIGPDNRITTLGRGGSDTSAVAIAAAINADRCDIYTDVDGVYTTDPRIEEKAKRIKQIAYEEMLEMAALGAKVLHPRSVGIAMRNNVKVLVRSSFDAPDAEQPDITGLNVNAGDIITGTLVTNEDDIMDNSVVSGVTAKINEAKITLRDVENRVGVAASIFSALAEANINVDMIVQNISDGRPKINLTFTVEIEDHARVLNVLQENRHKIPYKDLTSATDLAKVSIIGIGMTSHSGVAATMFQALAEKGINIQLITTSEVKISVLIDSAYSELAVRALHSAYNLAQE